uniref:Myb-like, SWIRM and MPN domain-containing protein 1 n=1 Tax=Amphiprion percula TaxID=161767 RepID=A0A3P8SZI1_AMPPE
MNSAHRLYIKNLYIKYLYNTVYDSAQEEAVKHQTAAAGNRSSLSFRPAGVAVSKTALCSPAVFSLSSLLLIFSQEHGGRVEVDIEGDDFDSNIRVDSVCFPQPWELDSSISPENREVIERMLLEEQYPFTDPECTTRCLQPRSSFSLWFIFSLVQQEKDLFEEGLAQFGRRWTKIAKLVGSRTVLQVKSYARQYFKHKAKSEPRAAAPSAGPVLHLQPPQPTSSHASTLANAVRIEKLSDDEDEDVDITDDLSDDEGADDKPQVGLKTEFCGPEEQTEAEIQTARATKEENEESSSDPTRPFLSDKIDKSLNAGPERDQEEEEDEDEEEEELKAPEQEIEMDMEAITEDEKQAIPEFFEGRPSKTPERYLKIRNYIVDQWLKSKPKYLNKTSVRPGLKNCGDVNCIGRIHTYLELIGAINFNCEQAVYNRPKVVDRSKHKVGKDVLEAYQLVQRLQSMRTRKRRVRDIWGNWCDAKDLEGQTYEHLSAEELALRREEMKKQPKPCKMSRYRGSFDPFQLIPCRSFEEDVQEPFQVIVCAETLLIMDMHAHVSRGEVIGLLGGTFNVEAKVLKICAAEPCNSVSTGLQCEMDPVSQTQACDVLSSLGFSVVGWYHSHPSFHPNPSVRDINTQDQFQNYFSRGGAPFIGMIVSPYDPANPSPHSQTTCLLVKESQEPSGLQSQRFLPYRFDFLSSQDIPDWEQTMRRAQWIIHKYSQTPGWVRRCRLYCPFLIMRAHSMLASLARYLESLPDEEGHPFLTQIQALFQSDFISKQQSSDQEEGESLSISSKPVDSDDLAFDQLISQETPQEGRKDSETNSSTVLHLGSVLSTEHDYLL